MIVTEDFLRIGNAVPDYEIERELGRGGMGIVFLGRHRRLGRGAAIKELPPTIAAELPVRERFVAEAKTLAGLTHPHIVPIFDYVERDGECLIIMQELPGGSVWDRFTGEGITPPTACAVVMAACAALQHAHDHGVLHLDMKPDNLMFDAESAVKVTDFGISQVITGGYTLGTVDGQVLGTPAYMAPEQARGEPLTTASDVYAAGVMLYELLSGQLPWHGATTAAELLQQRLTEDPIPIGDQAPHVPPALGRVVMRGIARAVEHRYPRAEDFGVAIGEAGAEAWGPTWIDHAGVTIVGSEKLALAARTTGHLGRASVATADPAPTDALHLPGARTTASPPSVPGAATSGGGPVPAGAAETGAVTPTGNTPPGAAETGAVTPTGNTPPGAAETGAVTPTGTTPPGAAETGAVTPSAPRAADTTAVGPVDAPAGAAETVARPPVGGRRADDGHGAPVDEPAVRHLPGVPTAPPLAFEAVKASSVDPRISGVDLYGLELSDLINVRDILDPPRTPWPPILLTAVLSGLALVVGLIGLGTHDRAGDLAEGQVLLDGADVVAAGDQLRLDLSETFTAEVLDPDLAARTDEVEIAFHYLGRGAPGTSAALRDGIAEFEPGFAQRAVGGATEADVRLLSRGEVVAHQEVGVDATQTRYLTGPFLVGVLLMLLAYAELESSLKPLRSGHSRIRSYLGAALWCPITAAGALLVLGAVGANELAWSDVVVAMALSVVAGAALVRARIGVARRRRVRTAVARAEKRLGQQGTVGTAAN